MRKTGLPRMSNRVNRRLWQMDSDSSDSGLEIVARCFQPNSFVFGVLVQMPIFTMLNRAFRAHDFTPNKALERYAPKRRDVQRQRWAYLP